MTKSPFDDSPQLQVVLVRFVRLTSASIREFQDVCKKLRIQVHNHEGIVSQLVEGPPSGTFYAATLRGRFSLPDISI